MAQQRNSVKSHHALLTLRILELKHDNYKLCRLYRRILIKANNPLHKGNKASILKTVTELKDGSAYSLLDLVANWYRTKNMLSCAKHLQRAILYT